MTVFDWIAGGCELTGSYLVGNKRKIGFICNAVGNAVWTYVAIKTEIYGLLLVVVPSLVLSGRNWLRWRRQERIK
jgi:hypothetical protein